MKLHDKTLEQVIRDNADKWGVVGSEYVVRVQNDYQGDLIAYIRPNGRDGETINFLIKGNSVTNTSRVSDEQK